MLIVKHTIETEASREDIWNIWQDVKNWNKWDFATEYSFIDGAFKKGTKGRWKTKGESVWPFTLTRIEPLKTFVVEIKLFLARIVSSHYLSESAGKTQITQHIEIKGPLALLFAYHAGLSMKKNVPHDMEALVKKAESLSKK